MPDEEKNFDMENALKIVENLDMNGREISNAVNTMRTLAREEGKKIEEEHFTIYVEVYDNFENVKEEGAGVIGPGGKGMRRSDSMKECMHCGCTCKGPAGRVLTKRSSTLLSMMEG